MWFLSARKTRRTPTARSPRETFRPRLEGLEDRCLMSAGALDPTFGSGGLVTGPSLGLGTSASSVLVQPADGKTVVAGYCQTGVGGGNVVFALERYNANGTLDTSFGTNGIVETAVGSGGSWITGLALQSDGKIVAVGSAALLSRRQNVPAFAVARYTPGGVLDSTFGSGGIVLTNVGTQLASVPGLTYGPGPHAVAIDGSGKIDVAGVAATAGVGDQFAVVRYNANGTLDKTFGPQRTGIVVTPQFANQYDEATALAIEPADGKIILAGYTGTGTAVSAMALARYTTTGQLDSSFGTSGIVMGLMPAGSTGASVNGVLVQSSGAIVAAGDSHSGTSYALTLTRVTSSGQLDTSFANAGFAMSSNMRHGRAIAQSANGDLLAAGTTQLEPTLDFGVAAYLPASGAPDTTFGTGGTTTADFGGNDQAYALAIQNDGKIVAAGVGGTSGAFVLARFLPPDTKIGSFTAGPNPVTAGNGVTLTASNILNSNPTSTISQVAFYQDANGDGILEPGIDTLLGYGTQTSPGVWTFSFSPSTSGTFTLFALATDNNGVLSDPVSVTLQVM
jgi:uncharacterized delta-60 repeat protein